MEAPPTLAERLEVMPAIGTAPRSLVLTHKTLMPLVQKERLPRAFLKGLQGERGKDTFPGHLWVWVWGVVHLPSFSLKSLCGAPVGECEVAKKATEALLHAPWRKLMGLGCASSHLELTWALFKWSLKGLSFCNLWNDLSTIAMWRSCKHFFKIICHRAWQLFDDLWVSLEEQGLCLCLWYSQILFLPDHPILGAAELLRASAHFHT